MNWELLPDDRLTLDKYRQQVGVVCLCGADVTTAATEYRCCARCGCVYRLRVLVEVAGPPPVAPGEAPDANG